MVSNTLKLKRAFWNGRMVDYGRERVEDWKTFGWSPAHVGRRCLTNQVLVVGGSWDHRIRGWSHWSWWGAFVLKTERAGGGRWCINLRAGWGSCEAAVSTAEWVPCVAASRRLWPCLLRHSSPASHLNSDSKGVVLIISFLGFVLSCGMRLPVCRPCLPLDGSYRYAHQCQYLLLSCQLVFQSKYLRI